jgi:hypothetical protein
MMGMSKRLHGENRKEIGRGIAEHCFAENTSFLVFVLPHGTARDAQLAIVTRL